jgi:drug/metabolite transporter (DMT)-like permease
MGWIALALIATFIDTLVLFIDRYVVEKEHGDVRGLPVITAVVSLGVGTAFWASTGFFSPEPIHMLALIMPGILILWANTLYFQAMPRQPQSSVIIVTFQLHPVFVMVLSWFFLDDVISGIQLLGFSLIIISVILLSVEDRAELSRVKLSPALWLLAISTLSYAFASILLKWATSVYTVRQIAAYQGFGMALGGVTIMALPGIRSGLREVLQNNPFAIIGIMSGNELLSQGSKLLRLVAISLGPVALVSAIGSMRVILGVWVGALLTLLAPGIFKEDIRKESLRNKSILSLITLMGLLLL